MMQIFQLLKLLDRSLEPKKSPRSFFCLSEITMGRIYSIPSNLCQSGTFSYWATRLARYFSLSKYQQHFSFQGRLKLSLVEIVSMSWTFMQHFSADLGRKRKLKLVYPQIKGKIFSFNYHDKYVDNFLPTIKKKK